MNEVAENISDKESLPDTHRLGDQLLYWGKRIGYRVWRLSAEILVVAMGVAIAWLYALSFLLTQQSVDITAANSNIGNLFADAVAGAGVDIPSMKLDWYPATDDIVFTGKGITIQADDGTPMQTLTELKSYFPLSDVRRGVMTPRKISVIGGVVSWVENEEGKIKAGLGTLETLGRLGPVWEGRRATAQNEANLDLNGIVKVDVKGATAFYKNSQQDLTLNFNDVDFTFNREKNVLSFDLQGNVNQGEDVPIHLSVITDAEFNSFDINYDAKALNPSRVAPRAGRFKDFRRINAPTNLDGSVFFDREKGLQSAELDLTLSEGSIDFPNIENSFAIEKFQVSAGLDLGESEMKIEQISLSSEKLNFTSNGVLSELGALNDGNQNSSPLFDLAFRNIEFDAMPILARPMDLVSLDMQGRFDADSRTLSIERYRLDRGTHSISGKVFLQENDNRQIEQVKADGRLSGILSPQELIDIWPVKFADGARRWIDRAIIEGKVDSLTFDTVFGLNEEDKLAEQSLTIDYTVKESAVQYISTMTPMTNAKGTARIADNSLIFKLESGNIGPVRLLPSQIEMPRLRPKGGDMIITANAAGQASDLLALINQKPFQYADKYGIDPSQIEGSGAVTLSITRPLLEFFERDRIQYAASGDFSNIRTPFSLGEHQFQNGDVSMTVDKTALRVKGEANIGPWRTNVELEEVFDEGLTPTKYRFYGPMDHTTLDQLGLGLREFFDGTLNMDVSAHGSGVNINSASITADLVDTEISLGEYWNKPRNEAGRFTASLTRGEGGTDVQSFEVQAPDLLMKGSLGLTPSYALKFLSLDTIKIADLLDGALQVQPDESREALSASFSGEKLDLSTLVDQSFETRTSSFDVPVMFTANVNELILDPVFPTQEASLLYSHDGVAVTGLRLSAESSDGPVSVNMQTDQANSERRVNVSLPDAAKAAKAFLGLDSLEKGKLILTGTLPLPGEDGAYQGTAIIEEFTLKEAPIMAQLLSLGSLTGLFNTLSGEGLYFERFEAPFQLKGGLLTIRDARVYGPALGMTGAGDINLNERDVDFDGALVPSYTANSLLGDIPLLGDIFVGKEGEGVFALNYNVTGPFDATQISVNPLSALTPGFLRGIFRKQRDEISEVLPSESNTAEEPETAED
jgi:hypothetical protein